MEAAAALHFLLKYICLLPFFAVTTVLILRMAWRPGFCFMIPSNSLSSCSNSPFSSSPWDRVRPKIGRYRLRMLLETEEKEENQECAVCLCGMEDGCEVWELRCKHLFHKGCLDKWVKEYRRVTCPLCRSALAPCEDKAGCGEAQLVEDDDEEEADSMVSFAVYMGISSWWLWW